MPPILTPQGMTLCCDQYGPMGFPAGLSLRCPRKLQLPGSKPLSQSCLLREVNLRQNLSIYTIGSQAL